jgi:Uma2 family endonuclease
MLIGMETELTRLPDGVALTYADLWELFGESTDGKRYELFQGALAVTPSPLLRHQELVARLLFALETACRAGAAGRVLPGPVDVILTPKTVFVPDIVFLSRARAHLCARRGVEGAPDLVVEVASPRTSKRDRGPKRTLYGEHGVTEYWIVDGDAERVERHLLEDGALKLAESLGPGAVLRTPLLTALALPIAELFAAG